MSELRFYDWDLNLLGSVKALSSNWTVYGNAVGTFQAKISYTHELFEKIMNERYIIAAQGNEQAIITGKDVRTGTVFGRTLNFLLTKRTHSAFSLETNTNLIAEFVIKEAFADEIEAGIFEVKESDTTAFTNAEIFELASRAECLKTVADILEREGACHKLYIDFETKKWIFEVYKGITRDFTLSEDDLTAYEPNYTEDALSYCNGGWYTQKATSEDEEDMDIYVSTAAADETLLKRWECTLPGSNETEAKSALAEKTWTKKITSKTRKKKHGIDYEIGDKLKIKFKKGTWKTTGVLTVSGVNKWYENNDIGEQPIFKE